MTALAVTPDGKGVLCACNDGVRGLFWPDVQLTGQLDTALPYVHHRSFAAHGASLANMGGHPTNTVHWNFSADRAVTALADINVTITCSAPPPGIRS